MQSLTQEGKPFYLVGAHFFYEGSTYHTSMLNYVGLKHAFIQQLSYNTNEDWVKLCNHVQPEVRLLVAENMKCLSLLVTDANHAVRQKACLYQSLLIPA